MEVSASSSPLKTNCCASKREKVLIGMQDLCIYTQLAYVETFLNKIRGQTKLGELGEALGGRDPKPQPCFNRECAPALTVTMTN